MDFFKTSLFALLFLLGFAPVSNGQELVEPDRGLKGGLASARFLNSPIDAESAKGFMLGVYMDFRFAQLFSLQSEIFYSEKGSKLFLPSFNNEFDLNLTYVEIPILVNFRPPAGGTLQPRIFAGPYAGILLNSSASVTLSGDNTTTPDDFVDEANDLDWGAVVGVGVDADLSFRTVLFEVRYSAGLTNTFNSSVAGDYKNGVLSILLGFSL